MRDGPQTFHEMSEGFLFYIDEDEKLDIEVDPMTERPLRSHAASGAGAEAGGVAGMPGGARRARL